MPGVFACGRGTPADAGDCLVRGLVLAHLIADDATDGGATHRAENAAVGDDGTRHTAGRRTAHREQLRPLLVELLAKRTKAEWFEALSAAGVASGPINTVDEGVAFATGLGLEPVVEVGDGDDAVPLVRNPITFSRSGVRYDLPPPTVGQQDAEVRAWLAGQGPVGQGPAGQEGER